MKKLSPEVQGRIVRFQRWVNHDVLPAIRRTGSYAVPAPAPALTAAAFFDALRDPHTVLALVAEHAQGRIVAERRAEVAEAQVEAARPAVEFVEALADTDDTLCLQDAGKSLGQAPNGFIAWLRSRGDLFQRNGTNAAKQDLIDRGLFVVRWELWGEKPRASTRMTGKGVVHYAKVLGVRPPAPPRQGRLDI